MGVVYYLMERLRQLMSSGWDYCVLWKLNEDPWLLECVDCCCGGTYQSSQSSEEELAFAASSTSMPCKDVMFQHPRTSSCELLSQLPPSLPLDGINAEVLISNQPRWLTNAKMSDLSTPGTKVLIPVPGGLVEFYASKMVQDQDQGMVDFVVSQCSALLEQEALTNKLHPNTSLPSNQTDFPPFSPSTALSNLNLSCADATADRIRICNSAMNFLQQFSYLTETRSTKDLDGSNDPPDRAFQSNHSQQQFVGLEGSTENNDNPLGNGNDNHFHHQQQQQNEEQEKGPLKHELGRPDSGSDSDPIDEEDDSKYTRRRNGKGNQSKNLVAERKRRKKLNERLYTLRSLVPKISKLDRAAILGDAIEYVMELQQQEKDLQNELEQNSDDEGFGSCLISNASQQQSSNIPMEYSSMIGVNNLTGVDSYEHGEASNGFHIGSSSKCQGENSLKRSHENKSTYDKGQQMEVQVEVAHLEGNEFFIKVFGEHRRGGFVRLMEALDSLGLEITTVNVTSCISLVSYVFTVEKKDSEIVQAEYLRETLLEMTRNQSGEWAEMAKAQAGGAGHHHLDQFQQQYFHHQFHQFQ